MVDDDGAIPDVRGGPGLVVEARRASAEHIERRSLRLEELERRCRAAVRSAATARLELDATKRRARDAEHDALVLVAALRQLRPDLVPEPRGPRGAAPEHWPGYAAQIIEGTCRRCRAYLAAERELDETMADAFDVVVEPEEDEET